MPETPLAYTWMAAVLLATIAAGTVRVWRGPTAADRMQGAMLFGTTGVAVLLLLARSMSQPVLNDVALVLTLLAAVTTVAFVQWAWHPIAEQARERSSDDQSPTTRHE